jgi:1,4-alpha-glucan branching enzyme
LIYTKGDLAFAFNFHPYKSFEGYFIPVGEPGKYEVVLSSDDSAFGGFNRVDTAYCYDAYTTPDNWHGFQCYLPSRSAIVLRKVK